MIAKRCVTAAVGLFLLTAILSFCVHAQKGIAGPGYYPSGYNGDIFTGEFAPSDSADQIKLVYKNGNKTQLFEGKIESPCLAPLKDKPTEGKELHLPSIPAGTVLTVYYAPTTLKVEGKKVHANLVWGIRFDTLNGQKLSNPSRPIISCSHANTRPFRVFNN